MPQVFLCKKPGCGARLKEPGWCDKHRKHGERQAAQRHKMYDNHRRNKDAAGFYHSKEWKRVRAEALKRDDYLCQRCLEAGKLKVATIVHHKQELQDKPELGLTLSNLESVCAACHNRLHGH